MTDKNNKQPVEKNWNKGEYLQERLDRRSRSFYIDTGNKFLQISLILAIGTLLMSLYSTYKVKTMPNHTSYYLNGVDGKIYVNNISNEKAVKVRDAILSYRAEKQRLAQEEANKKQ